MKIYKVLSEISFAARRWNPGECVQMSDDRAAKYLEAGQIEAINANKKTDSEDEE